MGFENRHGTPQKMLLPLSYHLNPMQQGLFLQLSYYVKVMGCLFCL